MNDIELYEFELIRIEMKRIRGMVDFVEYMMDELANRAEKNKQKKDKLVKRLVEHLKGTKDDDLRKSM